MRVLIVLGNRLCPDGSLSDVSRRQLERLAQFAQTGDTIIFSGRGSGCTDTTEAAAYQKFFQQLCQTECTILLEEKSMTTFGNLYYSRNMWWSIQGNVEEVILILNSHQWPTRVKMLVSRVVGRGYHRTISFPSFSQKKICFELLNTLFWCWRTRRVTPGDVWRYLHLDTVNIFVPTEPKS